MNGEMIRVAIVEDTAQIREAMRMLIGGSYGLQCDHVYPDAESALENLTDLEIDVVLMDINLPGMDGIECMRLLKPEMPNTHFMMCTVHDDDDNVFKALQAGATGYILKRTAPSQILDSIRELYHGGSPMSTEIARRVVASFQSKRRSAESEAVLSQREKEILELLSKGYLYKEIAEALFISKETVKTHIHNIYDKLHVQTRTEAINKVYPR